MALRKSHEVEQMMKVVGEEGTSLADFVEYLKGEFFDFVYLQQNAYDAVDESTRDDRQKYIFGFIHSNIFEKEFSFGDKENARHFFQTLRQSFKGWNSSDYESEEFRRIEREIASAINEYHVSGNK
jgi:V/A-type H+-transporting ATPase subunit A